MAIENTSMHTDDTKGLKSAVLKMLDDQADDMRQIQNKLKEGIQTHFLTFKNRRKKFQGISDINGFPPSH